MDQVEPTSPFFFFAASTPPDEIYSAGVSVVDLFERSTSGFVTGRDKALIAFDREPIAALVEDIVTVSEDEIIAAMRLVWERLKIIIEPSSAVPVAALLSGAVKLEGRDVGVILTGGNVDLDSLPWS